MKQKKDNEQTDLMDDGLIVLLVRRVMEDKPLGTADIEKLARAFFSGVLDYNFSKKEMQEKVKRFNQAIPTFLKGAADALDGLAFGHKKMLGKLDNQRKLIESLPDGVITMDHPDVISLARDLTDLYYTYSEAEKFVRTTRQTLQKYAKNNQYGLRIYHPEGKSPKLSREDLISYFRERFYKDYNFLIDLIERTDQS